MKHWQRFAMLTGLGLSLGLGFGPQTAIAAKRRGRSGKTARASKDGNGKKKKGRRGRRGKKQADDEAPPLTSHEIEFEIVKREKSIAVDRKRGIDLLEEFIQKHATSRAMPEALYRLAALYWERSQNRFLTDMEGWAKRVDQCKADPEQCPKGPPDEPQLDLKDSQTIYVRLITQYPRFRKIDTVHFLYGFSLRDQGKIEDAQKQFWAIIQNHPKSSFVPDAWLAVGDHRFYVDNDFRTALEAYTNVLNYPRSDPYAMALFKTAWCHWKLGDSEQSIRRFKEVLDQVENPDQDEEGRKRLADLREEALEYLVQVISEDETNTPKDIYDFLASIDGTQYSRKVLIRLAEAYEAQTRYDKSVPTYRFLIGLDKNHAENGEFQVHVVTGVRGDANTPGALKELGVLHNTYGRRSAWGKAHPKEAIEVDKQGEKLLFTMARSVHESAQAAEKATKVPDKDRYALAVQAYEDYTGRYPANPNSVEVSYLIGDIYFFKLLKAEEAGDSYLRVGESAPVGPLHRDALLAAISAYEQAMAEGPKPEPAKSKPEPTEEAKAAAKAVGDAKPEGDDAAAAGSDEDEGKTPGKTKYGRVERKFIHAVDLFSALFPKDDQIGSVLYKLGEFFYARGDYDSAVKRYGKVVVDYPTSENAGAAGDRILESLNRAEDYDNIELWAAKLKTAPSFKEPSEQARLNRIIVESLMKQGETLASRGYYARAANYYLRVPTEYPKHDDAPKALNNAGAALERAKKADAATDVYKRLAKDYPGTPQAAQATLIVAKVYENIADYDEAAVHYDQLVKKYPRHKSHADALYNAGLLYQALGKDDLAIKRYRTYSKRYSDRKDAVDVELRVGQVQADAGRHKAAVRSFQGFIRRHSRSDRSIEANTRLGKSHLARGRGRDANKALTRAVKAARTAEGEAKIYGAEARYLQGEVIYKDFEKAKLDPRPKKLGGSLERKANLLSEAKDVYLDVLTFNSAEWSTAALFRIGESYELFAKSLREYPVPKGLSEADEDLYVEKLNTFALAFEEQAIESYKSGYAKAKELKIYNRHTRNIRTALGRLSSQEFPPIIEAGTDVKVAEGAGASGQPIRRLKR